MAQPEPVKPVPDRTEMDLKSMLFKQFKAQFIQRQLALLSKTASHPVCIR